jgi:hypothetical protein
VLGMVAQATDDTRGSSWEEVPTDILHFTEYVL